MVKEDKKTGNKVGAIVLGLGLIGAGLLGGATLFPQTVTEQVPVKIIEYKDVFVDKIVEVEKPVLVEIEKEIIIEVEKDNENLGLVLKYVYDEGELEFLTEDLFEDELDLIVDRILLIEEVKSVSIDFALSNFARELERQHGYDKRDVSRIKVVKDSVEFLKESASFKYGEFETKLSLEYRYDGVVEEKEVVVEYYDGRVRNIKVN